MEELATIKLNYYAVKSYVDKFGKPKNSTVVPDDLDFEFEEGNDDEKLDDADVESDFNPKYDELDADDGDGDTEELQENEMS